MSHFRLFSLQNSHGQALVEYLFVMAFMALLLFNFTKGLNSVIGESIGSLRVILSNELSTGVCPQGQCVHNDTSFVN